MISSTSSTNKVILLDQAKGSNKNCFHSWGIKVNRSEKAGTKKGFVIVKNCQFSLLKSDILKNSLATKTR